MARRTIGLLFSVLWLGVMGVYKRIYLRSILEINDIATYLHFWVRPYVCPPHCRIHAVDLSGIGGFSDNYTEMYATSRLCVPSQDPGPYLKGRGHTLDKYCHNSCLGCSFGGFSNNYPQMLATSRR